jgi:hypothetical protein
MVPVVELFCTFRSACKHLKAGDDITDWQQKGYDSAWAPAGTIGVRQENCIKNPSRVTVTRVELCNPSAAGAAGCNVSANGRLAVLPPLAAAAIQTRHGGDISLAKLAVGAGIAVLGAIVLKKFLDTDSDDD